jgi:hypothetical protein
LEEIFIIIDKEAAMPRYNVIPNMLTLNTETKKIRNFSFGESLREQVGQSLVNLNFFVDNSIKKDPSLNQRYHFFWGKHNYPSVYYERRIIGKIFAKMLFEDSREFPTITINKSYLKWIRVRTNNIFPPGIHLTDIITVKLMEKGFIPLHCAGVSFNNKGILIFAPPNTGKTLTSMLLIQNRFKFISEDITVSDGNKIYGCPFTSTFRYYKEFSSKFARWLSLTAAKVPFIVPFIEPKATVIGDYVEREKIMAEAPISCIVILERGNRKVENLDESEATRRILNINRYEFNYYRNPMLRAYSYFNREFNLDGFMLKEEEIMKKIIRNKTLYLIRENSADNYAKYFKNLSVE